MGGYTRPWRTKFIGCRGGEPVQRKELNRTESIVFLYGANDVVNRNPFPLDVMRHCSSYVVRRSLGCGDRTPHAVKKLPNKATTQGRETWCGAQQAPRTLVDADGNGVCNANHAGPSWLSVANASGDWRVGEEPSDYTPSATSTP